MRPNDWGSALEFMELGAAEAFGQVQGVGRSRGACEAIANGSRGRECPVTAGIGEHETGLGNRKKSGGVFRKGVAVPAKRSLTEVEADNVGLRR